MLAPDPARAIDQLTGIFNSATGITQWVGTLVNATIQPLNPEPSWYTTINSALQASQKTAASWLDETAPDILAEMSDAFINYSSAFANTVKDLKPLLAAIGSQGNIPNANQVQDLTALVSSLRDAAAGNETTVNNLMGRMDDYRTQMKSDFGDLNKALASAMPQEAADLALVQQVQTQIQGIETTLAADSSTATADTLDTSNEMTSLAIDLTFGMEINPVSFSIGMLFIGIDAIINAGAEAQVISDLKQIEVLTEQLGSDELQLGLMQGIVSNLQNLQSHVENALATFDDFSDTWSFAVYGLNYLLVVLAQPQIDIGKIPDLNDLDAAVAAWQKMASFAGKVLDATVAAAPPFTISAPPLHKTASK